MTCAHRLGEGSAYAVAISHPTPPQTSHPVFGCKSAAHSKGARDQPPVEEVHSGTHAVSSAKISPQCPWHIEAAAHTGRAGGCTSTQDAGSQAKAANSRKADSVRFMCYLGLVARAGRQPNPPCATTETWGVSPSSQHCTRQSVLASRRSR